MWNQQVIFLIVYYAQLLSPCFLNMSSDRPRPKILLAGGDSASPPAARKPATNYLKSKAVSSSESPSRRIPVVNATAASAATKTPSARRLADKPPPSLSTQALQRPWKPAAMIHAEKGSLFPKAKKKAASPVTIAATSEEKVISSDHDAVTAFELNELKTFEESSFISSLVEESDSDRIEEQKNGEPPPVATPPSPEVKKKDTPLSNDVIEEAESKLMGTRKNKVLALVGAFETFISLQESEGQQIQKAFRVQHELQFQQDGQQAEKSFENRKNQC